MATKNTTAQQGNALVTLYIQCFENKYARKPLVNRYRVKWGFLDMISDLDYGQAQETIKYYFKTSKYGHPIEFLLSNYEKIFETMEEVREDEKNREKLRRQTEQRVRELNSDDS